MDGLCSLSSAPTVLVWEPLSGKFASGRANFASVPWRLGISCKADGTVKGIDAQPCAGMGQSGNLF